jgi:uncharacterized protein (AIM24 family)
MPKYELENSKLLKVTLGGEEIYAQQGTMIAYKGQVNFARSYLTGGGIQSMAMRAVTNEGWRMMTAQGSGEVFYARHGQTITIIALKGEMMCVESDSVLAFDRRLQTGTMFLGNQGGIRGIVQGAATGQGLFTTTLTGNGELAILSDGPTIALDVNPNNPIFVDPQAYIGHRGNLTPGLHTDVSWKSFLGQTSGESFQLKFTGQGTVYIQASER